MNKNKCCRGIVLRIAKNYSEQEIVRAVEEYKKLMVRSDNPDLTFKQLICDTFVDHPKYKWLPRPKATISTLDEKRRVTVYNRHANDGGVSDIPFANDPTCIMMYFYGYENKIITSEELSEILFVLHPAMENYLGRDITSHVFEYRAPYAY